MDGLIEGRIVHWVNNAPNAKQKHMAAIVVHVWDKQTGLVNLFVPPDMYDVLTPQTPTSVQFDPSGAPGRWHWIEHA